MVPCKPSCEFEIFSLMALSPLDGHYWSKVEDLAPCMSEYGLTYFCVLVEVHTTLTNSFISAYFEVSLGAFL